MTSPDTIFTHSRTWRTGNESISSSPNLMNVESPRSPAPLLEYLVSPHISASFIRFAFSHLFLPRLTCFLSYRLVNWPSKTSRCQSQCTSHMFRCPLHNPAPHFKESLTMGLYRCQSYMSLARSSLLAHGNSRSRLHVIQNSFGWLPPPTSFSCTSPSCL